MTQPNPTSYRPTRLWMTGSVAVVTAALLQGRVATGDERHRASRVSRPSPYGVHETLQRIEEAARRDGLSVLMRLEGKRSVIVLASSVGGTPVVMHEADPHPDMPMSVQVREGEGGGTEVWLAASADDADSDWTELPVGAADDLARLPAMLDRALA